MKSSTGYCIHCKKQMLIHKSGVNHILHLILTLVTFGAWAVVWIFLWFVNLFNLWRCSSCGTKVILGSTENDYMR